MISAPVFREPDRCPGALTLHEAADGQLARIRLPGGFVTATALSGLADLAERFGDGRLELTSRGNVQLRAIRPGDEDAIADVLADLGLLPSLTHERVRNIVASPLAGLDRDSPSLRGLVQALDRAVCSAPELSALSGRFLFAIDDGRGDTAVLQPDLSATWVHAETWELTPGGALVGADDVTPGLIALAQAFLVERAAQTSTAWHVRDLVDGARRVAARASVPSGSTPAVAARPEPVNPSATTHSSHVVAVVPLGRLTAAQARRLAAIAHAAGPEPLRITPQRRVVLPQLAPSTSPEEAARQLAETGLASEGDSIWENLTACAGQPGCAKALADVQRDATAAAQTRSGEGSRLAEHWSGCSRRCGHPRGRYLDVLAGPDGYTREVREAEVREPEAESVPSR